MTQTLVNREQTVLSCIGTDVWKEEVQKVIPKEIALEAMLRVARSVASDPKFSNVDPKSFLLALLKCSRAGLYPDGREAHLIAFGRDVQAIFDVKGICALAGRAGILVTPKIVLEKDQFDVEEDDGTGKTKVVHKADYRKPRGEIQAVYSRAVMPNGAVDYEIMSADEVEHVRNTFSKAKNSTPWKDSWGEMAKKTVVKRHSKRWDMSPEIRHALNADDDSLPDPKEMRVSAPIFKDEPAKEVEVVVEPAKAPPQPATVPVVPVPNPRTPKTPPAPATPVKPAEEPKMLSILEVLRQRLGEEEVTPERAVKFLFDSDQITASGVTLQQVSLENPEALDFLYSNFDDIVERIKQA